MALLFKIPASINTVFYTDFSITYVLRISYKEEETIYLLEYITVTCNKYIWFEIIFLVASQF